VRVNAGADLCVLVLLVVAEGDVAVVDLSVDCDDVDGAEAALAALAVGHHLVAGGVEHVQHRALARDLELEVRAFQAHPERFGRQRSAGAKGLVAEIGQRMARADPGVARGVQHSHRAAEQRQRLARQ
jgi:hypothetical protein